MGIGLVALFEAGDGAHGVAVGIFDDLVHHGFGLAEIGHALGNVIHEVFHGRGGGFAGFGTLGYLFDQACRFLHRGQAHLFRGFLPHLKAGKTLFFQFPHQTGGDMHQVAQVGREVGDAQRDFPSFQRAGIFSCFPPVCLDCNLGSRKVVTQPQASCLVQDRKFFFQVHVAENRHRFVQLSQFQFAHSFPSCFLTITQEFTLGCNPVNSCE